jgi:thiamine-phosphate pyrophosphorylase
MKRRQTMPKRWLIIDPARKDRAAALRALPPGTGVMLLKGAGRRRLMRRLRTIRAAKRIVIADESAGDLRRVHDIRELRTALLARTPLVLLSPLYPTSSHPDWRPLPPMRAAALARLAGRGLIALGGMDETRFRRVRLLGFVGWAGISAWTAR